MADGFDNPRLSRIAKLARLGMEGRWIAEFAAHHLSQRWLSRLPHGDGHSVLVFPGFLTSGYSTGPIRRTLTNLGYDVHDWGFGRNLSYSAHLEERMQDKVSQHFKESGRKVSLVGWSLGGVFAREIARARPEMVRNVISLGSPITGTKHVTLAGPIYEFLNGKFDSEVVQRIAGMRKPLPVPSSVLYSRYDGVVHHHGALQEEADNAENIRVPASHLGMGANPVVLSVIADRLCQEEDQWSRFEPSKSMAFLHRKDRLF